MKKLQKNIIIIFFLYIIWQNHLLSQLNEEQENFIQRLFDNDKQLKAIIEINRMGIDAEWTVPYLKKLLLEGKHNRFIEYIIEDLSNMDTPKSINAILDALKYSEGTIKRNIIYGIERLKEKGAFAVPSLIEIIKNRDKYDDLVLNATISALGNIGKNAQVAAPVLVDILYDPDAGYCIKPNTIMQLCKIQGNVQIVIPALIKAIKGRYPGVNKPFECCNGKPHTIDVEKHHGLIRLYAVNFIGKYATEAKEALPALIEAMNDKDPSIRSNAIRSIGDIDMDSEESIQCFIKALEDESTIIQGDALEILAKLGAKASSALPKVIKLLESPDKKLKKEAYKTIKKIKG